MSEIIIHGKKRQMTIEGQLVKTKFDKKHYNLTPLNPLNGIVVLEPSEPGWGGHPGVTQFVNVVPSSINVRSQPSAIEKETRMSNDGVFGESSEIYSDGTTYPPELGVMIQALGGYGYDITAYTEFVQN